VTLFKSFLSALLIFHFSSLLAPAKYIKISKFLWLGGNYNTKRMHLVKWNVVREPKAHGGLEITDPMISNLALRKNILWRLVSGNQEWWKKVIKHKYLVDDRSKMP
jgi:hypothetical protein